MKHRLLFVHPSVNKPCGPDVSLFELVRRLDRSRFESFLVAPWESDLLGKFEPFVSRIFVFPSARLAPNPRRAGELIQYLWESALGQFWLRKFLRTHRIDLVHINVETAQAVGWAARSLGLKTVVHMRGLTPVHSKALARLVTLSMRAAGSQFVAVSTPVAEAYRKAGIPGSRINIIPNGVDTAHFVPAKDKQEASLPASVPAGSPLIGAVSSADPRKGWAYLVMACGLLRRRHPQLRCLLIGDRESGRPPFWRSRTYLETLDALVESLGLSKNVIFVGSVADTAPFYRAIDLLAQPSVTDAGPRAVLEAMSCGVPVVATRVGGNADYIEDGEVGLLVERDDPTALANGVDRLLSNPALRDEMSRKTRQRVLDRFSIERHVEEISRLYDRLLDPAS